MRVFVVTGLELGWDCVVGVFDADKVSKSDLEARYPKGEYVIFSEGVQTEVEDD